MNHADDEPARRLSVDGLEVDVRPGTSGDVPLLLTFIRAMAAFEELATTATEASLREALSGESRAARVLLAFTGGRPIAYATWFFSFGTMVGRRCLWLDDLYVDPAFRARGIGRALMGHLARIAVRHRCACFEWMVLDWNRPAIAFYERLGATVLDGWRVCRMEEARLAELAGSAGDPRPDSAP